MSNAVARTLIYFVSVCALTVSALIHLVSVFQLDFGPSKQAKKQLLTRARFFLYIVVLAAQVECTVEEDSQITIDDGDMDFVPTVPPSKYSPCLNPWV